MSKLFESNPELANIGTQKQYSQYLDIIFPDSKLKDIVYHFGKKPLNKFIKRSNKEGIYFTTDSEGKYVFYPNSIGKKRVKGRTTAIINIKTPRFGQGHRLFKTTIDKKNYEYNIKQLSELQTKIHQLRTDKATKEEINKNYKPKIENYENITIEEGFKNKPKDTDGLIISKPLSGVNTDENFVVVFEPEQIHILGSKQDIEGFKEYINNPQDLY